MPSHSFTYFLYKSLIISQLAARRVWGRSRPTRPGSRSRPPARPGRISCGSFGFWISRGCLRSGWSGRVRCSSPFPTARTPTTRNDGGLKINRTHTHCIIITPENIYTVHDLYHDNHTDITYKSSLDLTGSFRGTRTDVVGHHAPAGDVVPFHVHHEKVMPFSRAGRKKNSSQMH